DAGMTNKNFLHFARIDVGAAGNNKILRPILERQKTVTIESTDVAGMEPAVHDRLPRSAFVSPIACHQDIALADDLTSCSRWHGMVLFVHDTHFDIGTR